MNNCLMRNPIVGRGNTYYDTMIQSLRTSSYSSCPSAPVPCSLAVAVAVAVAGCSIHMPAGYASCMQDAHVKMQTWGEQTHT